MNKTEMANLHKELHSFAVLRELLNDKTLSSFMELIDAINHESPDILSCYGAFASLLYQASGDFGIHLKNILLSSENPVVKLKSKSDEIPEFMKVTLQEELKTLTRLSSITSEDFKYLDTGGISLPQWVSTRCDFNEIYEQLLENLPTKGYGVFANNHMFALEENCELTPVRNADPQRLEDLSGYESEREKIIINTKALLQGLPSNNVLLYGDAGTGKSSTVKAIANKFKADGIRLIEIKKDKLKLIPKLMDKLSSNPLKFIIFIDDLSFGADDMDYTSLKAILEGDISSRPQNVCVYATSNRRHLMRETHSSREGDEIHLGDTLEEIKSLSARFGLTVTFLKPDRELYQQIILDYAKKYKIKTPTQKLLREAEAFAIRSGGRTPRAAKHFVEYKLAQEHLK